MPENTNPPPVAQRTRELFTLPQIADAYPVVRNGLDLEMPKRDGVESLLRLQATGAPEWGIVFMWHEFGDLHLMLP
jgi:hypothetical protein